MLSKRDTLFYGTIFLMMTNILVRGLGFFYRVVLMRLLGAEGVGLVEMVMPIYSFLMVLSSWGIPLAMSQKIAEENKRGNIANISRIFKSGRTLLIITGSAVTLLSYLFLPYIVKYFAADQRIYYTLFAILPAVFIIGVASAYRGYFQGSKQISVLGVSQSVEQTARVITGIMLLNHFIYLSIEKRVIAVALASVIAEIMGFLYLLWRFRKEKEMFASNNTVFSPRTSLSLIKFGIPVTINRLVNSAVFMLQAILIPLSLKSAGWDTVTVTEIYGRFSGVSMTLLHLPGVFTAALTVSVLPLVAESGLFDKDALKKHVTSSLQATTVFTLPGMIILNLFAVELCSWIFKSPLSAGPLEILTFGGIFVYLNWTLASILQGLGEVRALLINSIITGICLLIGIIVLTPIPSLGIIGTSFAVNISYICGFLLNLVYFYHVSHISLPWKNILFKPLFAGISAAILIKVLENYLFTFFPSQEKMAVLAMVFLFGIIYFLILVVTGGLSIGVWRRIKNRN